jgi:hypothetical protein
MTVVLVAIAIFALYARRRGDVARLAFVVGLFAIAVISLLFGEILNSIFFVVTGTPYPGETMDTVRRFAFIGVVGLLAHIYLLVGQIADNIGGNEEQIHARVEREVQDRLRWMEYIFRRRTLPDRRREERR